MNGKKIIKYFFLAGAAVAVVGFFLTFKGASGPRVKSDDLPPEQMESIKKAANDAENLKIFGDNLKTNMPEQKIDPSKLNIIDLKVGGGLVAEAGDKISVNYVGTLLDGLKFDSSYDRNQPFAFVLGAGQVIQGWDEGVKGMREGGKRKLVIPANMAYGASGVPGAIPPNAALIFEVELLKILESPKKAQEDALKALGPME